MIRSHIAQMTGQVVGYKSARDVETMPVRIMDSRLWEIHTKPAWHMEVSMEMRPSRQGDVQIGYPVLALYGAQGEFREQRAELEAWLHDTDVTLEDLLNEHGERRDSFSKGDFARGDFSKGEKSKGVLPKGVFFKVISGRQLFADYAAARAAEIARSKRLSDEWKKNMDLFQHAAETGVELEQILANMGFTPDDGKPLVQPQGIGTKRVNVDVDVLAALVHMSMHMSKECDWCGANAALLPHDTEEKKGLWLCETCHPRVVV